MKEYGKCEYKQSVIVNEDSDFEFGLDTLPNFFGGEINVVVRGKWFGDGGEWKLHIETEVRG
jgi:hypothetical protein